MMWFGVIVFIYLAVTVTCVPVCKVPYREDEVDWSKMSGVWYEAFYSDNEFKRNGVTCYVLQDIKISDKGFKSNVTQYYSNSVKESYTSHGMRKRPGVYMTYQPNTRHDEHKRPGVYKTSQSAEKRTNYESDTLMLTDYDNYFLRLTCSDSGNWIVWGYLKKTETTAEDILPALDRLAKYGFYDKLYPSGCSAIDFAK